MKTLKSNLSIVLPQIACCLMVIVYALYITRPAPPGYTTAAYVLFYKTVCHLVDMIPFLMIAAFSFMQKTAKHRRNRSLPLYALAVKYVIDSIACLLFATRVVKNLTFVMLAEEKAFSMVYVQLLLIGVGWVFSQKAFIVADILFLLVLSIFSFHVLRGDPTLLRIIWGLANFTFYLSLIPMAETMTVGNTFSNTYLKIVNYFRLKNGLDVIEPEEIIYDDEVYDDEDDKDSSNFGDEETSDDTSANEDDAR